MFYYNRKNFINRDLVAELPFILMHPKPLDDDLSQLVNERSPNRLSIDKRGSNSGHANDNGNVGDGSKKDEAPNLIQLDA